jgi:hypothetical protein
MAIVGMEQPVASTKLAEQGREYPWIQAGAPPYGANRDI